MLQHSMILILIIPLLSSLVSFSFYNKKVSYVITLLSSIATNTIAASLLLDVLKPSMSAITYAVGGWTNYLGIELIATPIGALMAQMIHVAYFCSALFSYPNRSGGNANLPSFYTLLSIFTAGLTGMSFSNDAFNIFVFLEVASIAGYAMVAMGGNLRASLSAFDYLLVGSIGASFYLLGVGVIYLDTGILNLSLLRFAEKHIAASTLASVFMIIGLSIKAAIFPVHLWLVNAYRYAPSCFSMLSGAIFTKVIILVILKTLPAIISADNNLLGPKNIMLVMGTITMVFGAISACIQKDWRSIIANSSISQVGYILVGFAIGSFTSVESAIATIIAHTFIQISLFAISGLSFDGSKTTVSFLTQKSTLMVACVIILLCSIVGIPGTAGFISKWLILESSIANHMWVLTASILLTSALAVNYCVKLVEQIMFSDQESEAVVYNNMCTTSIVTVGVFLTLSAAVILSIGLYPKSIAVIARGAMLQIQM